MEGYRIYLLTLLTIIVIVALCAIGLGIKTFLDMDKITRKAKKEIENLERERKDV